MSEDDIHIYMCSNKSIMFGPKSPVHYKPPLMFNKELYPLSVACQWDNFFVVDDLCSRIKMVYMNIVWI